MAHDPSKNIFSILGLEHSPQAEKDALLDMVTEETLMAFFKRIESRLSPDKREEMYRLFETETSNEQKAEFFKTHAPDAESILMEEITRIKQEALAKAGASEIS